MSWEVAHIFRSPAVHVLRGPWSNKAAAEVARLRSTTHIRRQMLSCWAWGEWDGEERGDAGNWEAIQMHELEMKPKRVFKLVFGTAILQITYICI